MGTQIVIKTHGGFTLRAPVAAVVVDRGAIRAEWDMRHNLIHNPRFAYAVRPADVKEVQYV